MRLDARTGDIGWQCFDMERMAIVTEVTWVDTESATWGEFDLAGCRIPPQDFEAELPQTIHYERRIDVLIDQRMVLFNALDDNESIDVEAILQTESAR